MTDKDKVSKAISTEDLENAKKEKDRKIKSGELYEQPPSDSDDDICGPLNCDKEL